MAVYRVGKCGVKGNVVTMNPLCYSYSYFFILIIIYCITR